MKKKFTYLVLTAIICVPLLSARKLTTLNARKEKIVDQNQKTTPQRNTQSFFHGNTCFVDSVSVEDGNKFLVNNISPVSATGCFTEDINGTTNFGGNVTIDGNLTVTGIMSGGALSFTIFVDGGTTVPVSEQDGSISKPYSTIQAAVNTIPEGVDAATQRSVHVVLIAPGIYDEDVTIEGSRRRIALIGIGPVHLGLMSGSSWTPTGGDTRRDITWNCSGGLAGTNIRPALTIASFLPFGEGRTTHQSYNSKFRISGDLTMNNTTGGSAELQINAEIFGDLNVTNGISQIYISKSCITGAINGDGDTNFQVAENCRFNGPVTVGAWSTIISCDFRNGMTAGTIGNGGIQPDGMQLTRFVGTFTAPAGQSLRLDSYTNWWFDPYEGGTASVSAGVTKKLIFSSRL